MSIMVEPCTGCGRILLIHPVANLKVRLDSFPLEPDGAVQALMSGRNLWRVTETSVRGARPAELAALRERGSMEGPRIHQEHRCTAVSRPNSPSPVPEAKRPPKGSQRPPVDRSVLPGSDPRPARSSAPSADRPRSDGPRREDPSLHSGPRCDDCGLIMKPGDYAAIQIGEIYAWAQHLTNCG